MIETKQRVEGLISIIIPCYKAENFLLNILNDVRQQKYDKWELLIVSNGEGQAPQLRIANKFAEDNKNVQVLVLHESGAGNARNKGMEMAIGEWFTFLDADDRIDSDHLQKYMDAVESASIKPDIVIGGFYLEQKRNGGVCMVDIPKYEKKDFVLNCSEMLRASSCNKLYRADFVGAYRFNVLYSMREDAVFNSMLILNTDNILTIPISGYHYILCDVENASSKYHATYEESLMEYNSIQLQMFQRLGVSDETIKEWQEKHFFYDSFGLARNLFKKGSHLSVSQQRGDIKRMIYQNPLHKSCLRWYPWGRQTLLDKMWIVCLRIESSLFVVFVLRIQYWVKNHFFTIFMKLWPLLSK